MSPSSPISPPVDRAPARATMPSLSSAISSVPRPATTPAHTRGRRRTTTTTTTTTTPSARLSSSLLCASGAGGGEPALQQLLRSTKTQRRKMRVADLRADLRRLGLDSAGKKEELLERLEEAIAQQQQQQLGSSISEASWEEEEEEEEERGVQQEQERQDEQLDDADLFTFSFGPVGEGGGSGGGGSGGGGSGSEISSRSRISDADRASTTEFKRISELFLATESWQGVTGILETYQGNLNEVNVSIAWSALGRSVRFSRKDRQEMRESKGEVLIDLVATTVQLIPSMSGTSVASTLVGLSYLKERDVDAALQQAVYQRLEQICYELSAKNISNIIWGFSKLNFEPPAGLLLDITERAYQILEEFSSQGLSTFSWGLARLRFRPDDRILEEISRHLVQRIDGFSAQSVSNIVYAFALLGYQPDQHLMDIVGKHAAVSISAYEPQSISLLLWAFARLGITAPVSLLYAVETEFTRALEDFKPLELNNLLHGYTRLQPNPDKRFLGALARRGLEVIDQASPTELCSIIYNLGAMSYRPPQLHSFSDQLSSVVDQLDHFAKSNVLGTFATWSANPPAQVLEAVRRDLREGTKKYTPPSLSVLLWSFAVFILLGVKISEEDLNLVYSTANKSIDDFKRWHLRSYFLLHITARLSGFNPPISKETLTIITRAAKLSADKECEKSSKRQEEICDVLKSLKIAATINDSCLAGTIRVDLSFISPKGTNVAVMVDTQLRHRRDDPSALLGKVRVYDWILRTSGWVVYRVRLPERWATQKLAWKQTFLEEILADELA